MKQPAPVKAILISMFIGIVCTGCQPEVGSEKWCTQLEETPKGDWTANMAADYTKYCVLKMQNK